MVDMEGIDILSSYGDIIPGLYQKLVESITPCRYQCLYNWYFNGVLIPPTYVEMTVNQDTDDVWINDGVFVTSDDCMLLHLPSLETVSGPVVYITDALSRSIEGLICYINPLQTGSGDPSPNNIRPISGFLEINVYDEEVYGASETPILTVNWQSEAGTIYQGTFDMITGELTATHAKDSRTWGSLTLIETLTATKRKRFDYTLPASIVLGIRETAICNVALYNQSASIDDTHFYTMTAKVAAQIYLPLDTPDSTIVEICYPLDNPIVYHFTPFEFDTRFGTNIMWHDANGDISVTYWKK